MRSPGVAAMDSVSFLTNLCCPDAIKPLLLMASKFFDSACPPRPSTFLLQAHQSASPVRPSSQLRTRALAAATPTALGDPAHDCAGCPRRGTGAAPGQLPGRRSLPKATASSGRGPRARGSCRHVRVMGGACGLDGGIRSRGP